MDWDCYKHLCDQPETFSRWMLEQTAELLPEGLQARLRSALVEDPLRKPDHHLGDRQTDMFQLSLEAAQARAIHERVRLAVSAGETTSGTRKRGLGGFEEAWREYLRASGEKSEASGEKPDAPGLKNRVL